MNKVPDGKTKHDDLRRLADLPDAAIDTDDMPEVSDWRGAVRGRFYRPVKQQVTIRLDADVLAWFKAGGVRYQTRINAALRDYIARREGSTTD